ncbi:hypothetical protein H4R33_003154 [Dimargaris cristalligena]|nr:hypothetical protein H4R33_003154 [Dimargaris cristalligena]
MSLFSAIRSCSGGLIQPFRIPGPSSVYTYIHTGPSNPGIVSRTRLAGGLSISTRVPRAFLTTSGLRSESATSKLIRQIQDHTAQDLEAQRRSAVTTPSSSVSTTTTQAVTPPEGSDPATTESPNPLKHFRRLKLDPPILELIADQTTWERPTAIQRVVVPAVLTGQSVVASACTGQGKTAAFGLPILNLIHNYKKSLLSADPSTVGDEHDTVADVLSRPLVAAPLALILAPSYDLASQILEDLNLFGNPLGVHSVILSNESTYEKQLQRLDPTVDIIVGTPGRILTHIKKSMEAADPGVSTEGAATTPAPAHEGEEALTITNPRLDLSRLRHFVVDECDRLFGLGFLPDVQAIWQALPRPDHRMQRTVQMVITSATIVPAVHNFILRVAPVHRLLDLNATLAVPKTVTQLLYEVSKPRKLSLLLHFLKRRGNVSLREGKVLVFTRTISRCERIAEGLREKRYTAAALNSDCTNAQRKAILTDFALGHISVVVATDIATRGLDIPGLTHVINFDVPNNVEDYIHRVGRTGRAGEKGTAITFVCKEKEEFYLNDHQLVVRDEQKLMAQIEEKVGNYRTTENGIQRRKIPGPFLDAEQVWKSKMSPRQLEKFEEKHQHNTEARWNKQKAEQANDPSASSASSDRRSRLQESRRAFAIPSSSASAQKSVDHPYASKQPFTPVRDYNEVLQRYDAKHALSRGVDPHILNPSAKAQLNFKQATKSRERQFKRHLGREGHSTRPATNDAARTQRSSSITYF